MSTTSSEPYRKAGRGGAGNYHSKKDLEDAQRNNSSNNVAPSPLAATVQSLWAQYMPAFPFAKDPEPSLPSTEPTTTFPSPSPSSPQPQPQPQSQAPPLQKEYLHTGRGGAGNWEYASQTSQSSSQTQSPTPSTNTQTPLTTSPPLRSGRGGAGNFIADPADEEKARRDAEEKRRRAMEERILEDVEAGLARPEAAYGGVGGAWEMGVLREGGKFGDGR